MGVNNLAYSNAGLKLTEKWEGLDLNAYQDQVHVWTIGYGHTGLDVTPGLKITQAQAQDLLAKDVSTAVDCVNHAAAVPLNQNQFDALVDFVFNLGGPAFLSSTLLRDLNQGNFGAVPGQILLWDHAGGAVVPGLLARRQDEASLFTAAMAN